MFCIHLLPLFVAFASGKGFIFQVGLWEEGEEEEWKVRVGDRLKEKLERAREGEKHHVLDHEEEHWMQMSGIQIHHVSKREGC